MQTKYTVAFEFDYSSKGKEYKDQISRLTNDGRFDIKYLRSFDSEPSHEVAAEELKDVDFYIIMGHRLINNSTLTGNKRLKWIGRFGAGFENVDIPACNEHSVLLSNSPYGLRESVAETALTFILAHTARLIFFDRYIRNRHFKGKADYPTRCVAGRTLGLLATGGIAQRLAELVKPLNMRVLGFDPYANQISMAEKGIELKSLEEVMRESDYVSCHIPLTPSSRGMLTEKHFRLMKPTACFINTSRGGIYEDKVLAKVLQAGVIAGAAVDVFEDEPHVEDNPLLECENAILTPHIAGAANNIDAIVSVIESLVTSVLKMADGELPDSILNPEASSNPVDTAHKSPSFHPRT